MAHILIVEDEALMRETLRRGLELLGHQAVVAADGVRGLEEIISFKPDMVLLDLFLSDEYFNGLELLERIRTIYPELPVVVMSGYGTVDSAVEAMKMGAREFVQKPFDIGQIASIIDRVLEVISLRAEVATLRSSQGVGEAAGEFVYASASMQAIAARAHALGENRALSALVCGEIGSGKTALTRYIHEQVQPHTRPLISVSCYQIAVEGRAPDEIFGNPASQRVSRCELADGGSIVFEEVGCLGEEFQRALLDFIDNRCIGRAGNQRRVDVRIMATSTAHLAPLDNGGAMLPELLQRLGANSFFIPPLRERVEDIEPLCRSFLSSLSTHGPSLDIDACMRLLPSDGEWSGNVGELRNWVERIWLEYRVIRCEEDFEDGEMTDV